MPAPQHSVFLQAGCPSCRPTNSVKALKAQPGAVAIGTESMQIQLAHCRFPGLAMEAILSNNTRKLLWFEINKSADCKFKKKILMCHLL